MALHDLRVGSEREPCLSEGQGALLACLAAERRMEGLGDCR